MTIRESSTFAEAKIARLGTRPVKTTGGTGSATAFRLWFFSAGVFARLEWLEGAVDLCAIRWLGSTPCDRRGIIVRLAGEDRMSTSMKVTFPKWVPPAVIDAAKQIHAETASEENPVEAEEFWSRLVFDPRMERVWKELYKKKRIHYKPTEEFAHPACMTNASIAARNRRLALELRQQDGRKNKSEADFLDAEAALLEGEYDPPADPRWSEQERAMQLFLLRAYQAALDHELVYLSDLEAKVRKLQNVAKRLRSDAAILSSFGMEREARKLKNIASHCDDEAFNILPYDDENSAHSWSLKTDDRWIIVRRQGDLELRAFVVSLSIITGTLFRKILYGTLATVSNVRFDRQDVTAEKVREMLRP
jgi:hypothetical protein